MSTDALRSYLRTLRIAQRLSRSRLAERIGVREQLLATWERGQLGSLKDSVLLRMAQALHATLDDMIALEQYAHADAAQGRERALARIAALQPAPSIPEPLVIRVIALDRLAARIDHWPLRVPARPGERTYEGQRQPDGQARLLVDGQPATDCPAVARCTPIGWGHPGQATIALARSLLWHEFGDAALHFDAGSLARDVFAAIPAQTAAWVMQGIELQRWARMAGGRCDEVHCQQHLLRMQNSTE